MAQRREPLRYLERCACGRGQHRARRAGIAACVGFVRSTKPPPVGATPENVDVPTMWDQLLPLNGRSPKPR